jgi:hypothetical protein
MISAGRIAKIFHNNGGGGRFTKIRDEISDREASIIQDGLTGEEPLIVSVRSKDEWFAFTKSRVISKSNDHMRSIPLDQVDSLVRPDDLMEWARGKRAGGKLDVRLKDGTLFTVHAESGRPFMALMNVFIYLEKVNREKASGLGLRIWLRTCLGTPGGFLLATGH